MAPIGADEDVDDCRMPVGEGQLALAGPEDAYGREGVAPLDAVRGSRVDHDLAQDGTVDLGAYIERLGVLFGVLRGEDVALRVADAEGVGLGTRVLCEDLSEAVLAEGPLAAFIPEVEHASEVGTRVDARLALVDCRRDATAVEGDEESKACRSSAYDCDARVSGSCHGEKDLLIML